MAFYSHHFAYFHENRKTFGNGITMSTIDEKRAAFHQYLASSGVISALSKALIKLYEEPQKPDDPVNFVRRHMGSEDFFILGDGKVQNAEKELVLSSLIEKKGDDTEEVTVIDKDEIEKVSPTEVEEEKVVSAEDDDGKQTEDADTTVNTDAVETVEGADDNTTDAEGVDQLLADFEKMKSDEECDSMLKKHLTDEIFEKLRNVNTDDGVTFADCIKSGLENGDSVVGIYAANLQCYDQFSDIFDPVIEAYHGFGKEAVQPSTDWGDPQAFEPFNENGEVVVSIRISCARNIQEYPAVCRMSEENLNESLAKIKATTEGFQEGAEGAFYQMADLSEDQEAELKDIGALIDNQDKYLSSADVFQNWPTGRGAFVSNDKAMIIHINAEDHLKFTAKESSREFGKIYQRLVDTVALFELPFVRHDRLGWLTFSPSNLGTSLNIAVDLKLPKLHSNPDKLQEIIQGSSIQLKLADTGEENTYTLTNQATLTECSEFELAQQFYGIVQAIIEFETSAESSDE